MRCMKKTAAQREVEYETAPAPKKNQTLQKGTLKVHDRNSGKTETLKVNSVQVSDTEHQRIGQKMVELAQAKQGLAQTKQEVANARQGIAQAEKKIALGEQKIAEAHQQRTEAHQQRTEAHQQRTEARQTIAEAKIGQEEAAKRIEKANQASTEIVKKMLLTQTADEIAHDPRLAKLDPAMAYNLVAMAKELEAKANM